MNTRSMSFVLIVALFLVFLGFLQLAPLLSVRAGGLPAVFEIDSGQQDELQNQSDYTPVPREKFSRPVELRLEEGESPGRIRPSIPLDPETTVEMVIDDGGHFSAWGVGCTGGTAKQFLWFNRFSPDPSLFPFYLNEIWVLFDDGEGENNVHAGDLIDLVVFQDPDGDPTNGATRLATYARTIKVANGSDWSTYPLKTPLYVSGPGDVMIAVINRYTQDCVSAETFPAAIDYTANQDRSWMGWWDGAAPKPVVLPPDASFNKRLGNWMIRGYGETTTDQITPTVTQVSGNSYLPYVLFVWPPTPEPTPSPKLAVVNVENDTGGQLCYEVLNTGIGEKCFPEGKHYYGSFPPGDYEWKATAPCGSGGGTKQYGEGEIIHRFWCTRTILSDRE